MVYFVSRQIGFFVHVGRRLGRTRYSDVNVKQHICYKGIKGTTVLHSKSNKGITFCKQVFTGLVSMHKRQTGFDRPTLLFVYLHV